MKKIILTMIVISSSVFGYKVIDDYINGAHHLLVIECNDGSTGNVIDYGNNNGGRYWISNPSGGHRTLDSAARALCGE